MNDNLKKKIGERINAALIKENKKQKELAQELGVTDNTISYFVTGTRTPNIEQIIKIASYLNTTADYLLGITDVKVPNLDTRSISEKTGLSEEAIQKLKDHLNEPIFSPNNVIKYINNFITSDFLLDITATLNGLKHLDNVFTKEAKILNFVSQEKALEYVSEKKRIANELFDLCGERAEIVDYADRVDYRIYQLKNILLSAFLEVGELHKLKSIGKCMPFGFLSRACVQVDGGEPVFVTDGIAEGLAGGIRLKEDGTEFINKYTVKEGETNG